MPIHSISLCYTFYIRNGSGMESEAVYSLNHDTIQSHSGSPIPHFPIIHSIPCLPTCTSVTMKGCTHMPIPSMSRCKNTIHLILKWDGSLNLFTPSTMTPTVSSRSPISHFPKHCPQTAQVLQCRGAPTQHIKVLKHFQHIHSLKHDTIQSVIRVHPYPKHTNSGPFTCVSATL
jgi:hypothetical protein